jgi:hypothetical protein
MRIEKKVFRVEQVCGFFELVGQGQMTAQMAVIQKTLTQWYGLGKPHLTFIAQAFDHNSSLTITKMMAKTI